MTRVIKSATDTRVRAFGVVPPTAPVEPSAPSEAEGLRREIAVLTQALDAANASLERAQEEQEKARTEGETAGFRDGLNQAERREAERLDRLGEGVEAALAAFAQRLAGLEPLAAALARRGLERVLGDPAEYPDLVARVIAHQLGGLAAESTLRVEVSRIDFPDEAALAALAAKVARTGLELSASRDLPAGACETFQHSGIRSLEFT